MVLILDGNSEHGTQVLRIRCFLKKKSNLWPGAFPGEYEKISEKLGQNRGKEGEIRICWPISNMKLEKKGNFPLSDLHPKTFALYLM